MNIGSLYAVKQWFWLLFPTKETAAAVNPASPTTPGFFEAVAAFPSTAAAVTVDFWSKHFNCEVTYFSSDSFIVFLEEDGKYKKVLTSEGRIGWTWFSETYNECFEEVSS